jgi:hypothetical protein
MYNVAHEQYHALIKHFYKIARFLNMGLPESIPDNIGGREDHQKADLIEPAIQHEGRNSHEQDTSKQEKRVVPYVDSVSEQMDILIQVGNPPPDVIFGQLFTVEDKQVDGEDRDDQHESCKSNGHVCLGLALFEVLS